MLLLSQSNFMSKSLVTIWMILMIGGRIAEANIKDIQDDCSNPDCPDGPYCFGFQTTDEDEFTDCNLTPSADKCVAFGAVRKIGQNFKFQLAGNVSGSSGFVAIGFIGKETAIRTDDFFVVKLGIVCLIEGDTQSIKFVVDPATKTVANVSGGSVSIEGKHIYCEFEINDKPHNGTVKLKTEDYKFVLFGNAIDGKLENGNIQRPTYIVSGQSLLTKDVFTGLKTGNTGGGAGSGSLPGLPFLMISVMSLFMTFVYYLKY